MTKTNQTILLEKVGNDLVRFLKQGTRPNLVPFTEKIDPNLIIDDWEKLLRIHFVLKKEVIDFVGALPKQIRRIKTTAQKIHEQTSGEIRGKIDWQRTRKTRYCTNPEDEFLFIINRIERSYNTPENLVLKKLLSIIHSIVFQELDPAINKKYNWIKQWVNSEKNLRETVKRIYHKNIYIRRIESDPIPKISSRILSNTRKSRNPLYSKAAELLQSYQKLMNYDLDLSEAKKLLKNTFIAPDRAEVLFELYWTFQVIHAMTEKTGNLRFHLLESGNKAVAEWEDEAHRYYIYHDSTGSFNFFEDLKEIKLSETDDGYLKREGLALKKLKEEVENIFSKETSGNLWGGRPDILVEKYPKGDNKIPCQVFIGEVKYTTYPSYAAQGLRELLEYMALAKKNKNYFEDDANNVFTSDKIKGWLFLDKMETGKPASKNISVIKFDDDDLKQSILS